MIVSIILIGLQAVVVVACSCIAADIRRLVAAQRRLGGFVMSIDERSAVSQHRLDALTRQMARLASAIDEHEYECRPTIDEDGAVLLDFEVDAPSDSSGLC